ncbi:hypothetical protein ACFLV5_04150 [Chloroflexota bacterium]
MSKNETPLIRKYWRQIGGTLIEEFLAVRRSEHNERRLIDAVIILDGETKIAKRNEVSLMGKDIVCVQAKTGTLGMYLMGQALFSSELLQKFKPKKVTSVALCTKDDSVLRPLIERYNVQVVIVTPD